MNKAELVDEIADEVGLTKINVNKAINTIIEVISDVLFYGDKVTLVGFGTFKVIEKKARKGRNPQTGKEIQIPAKKVPKFLPGKKLKKAVR